MVLMGLPITGLPPPGHMTSSWPIIELHSPLPVIDARQGAQAGPIRAFPECSANTILRERCALLWRVDHEGLVRPAVAGPSSPPHEDKNLPEGRQNWKAGNRMTKSCPNPAMTSSSSTLGLLNYTNNEITIRFLSLATKA